MSDHSEDKITPVDNISHHKDTVPSRNDTVPSPTYKEGSQLITESQKESKYPKSVFFIVSNEFCERFSYFGMRAILIIYLTTWLGLDASVATAIFHSFVVLCYFSPMFGAVIADGYLGKYHTILYVSLVYTAGNIVMTFTAFPPPYWVGPMFGLILIGLGTGGIKPCVSAFGGDQFASDQTKQRHQFFSVFYFAINLGSFLSMMITPFVRENVHCFGHSCFPIAFGIPAVLMLMSLALFIFGRHYYKIYPATGSVIREMFLCVGRAIKNRTKSSVKKAYWLHHAEDKYDMTFLDDVRRVLHVFWLFLPLPVFWALFDQQGSRWTLQSTQLDLCVFGSWYILPDQVQAINSVLILAFIPLFEIIVYPALDLCRLPHRPIQRMVVGMLLAAISFVIAGFLQIAIDKSLAEVHLNVGQSRLSLLNTSPCTVTAHDSHNNTLGYESIIVPSDNDALFLTTTCPFQAPVNLLLPVELNSQKAYFVLTTGSPPTAKLFTYPLMKPRSGGTLVGLIFIDHGSDLSNVTAMLTKSDGYAFKISHLELSNFTELFPGSYDLALTGNGSMKLVSTSSDSCLKVESGAVRTVVVEANSTQFHFTSFINVHANTVSVWLQFPQYIIITIAEILFSITGLSFGYSQAPESMKSVVQAAWLLTTAFGDLIVVIIAGVQVFSQTTEFFFFALLMAITTIVFGVMGYFYKYVSGTVVGTTENEDVDKMHLTATSHATASRAPVTESVQALVSESH